VQAIALSTHIPIAIAALESRIGDVARRPRVKNAQSPAQRAFANR